MLSIQKMLALGLMSGSSLDGVDASIIETDGVDVFNVIKSIKIPYEEELANDLRCFDFDKIDDIERKLTEFNAEVVKEILGYIDAKIDVIGFYGHTVKHNPREAEYTQIGDGQLLFDLTGIKVVNDFQKADILAGGQGEPITAIYHQAIANNQEKPVVVVNIGGISTITFVGSCGSLIAFDSGPGNAIINDWVYKKANMNMDYNGKLAVTGKVNEQVLATLMKSKYLSKCPPKIVIAEKLKDKMEHLQALSLEDGTATATAFVAKSIAQSIGELLPEKPCKIVICGGGAKNPTMLRMIKSYLPDIEVITSNEIGFDCEYIEAQSMAYLACRRLNYLPSTFPSTTGCFEAAICGKISG